ncbi:head completion/stabilization protein [Acinetobacter sp. ANC 4173]|uniref:head completion/stabilization protein n=1 Tax=Acinetobacter sp. ANC 4173 TaxID=2529837 RepID=UPI00103C5A27|nr:head completion/stabilization protein [Acinetobacter sp. ANC 4173]TCB81641.1 head completion/stabilization protein [Acinetobacter sp. ANC 4173]
MTGFSFNAPTTTPDESIGNDGFFPNLQLNLIRESVRLDGSVSNARLKDAAIAAILEINDQLRSLKLKAATLNELATSTIDGKPNTELLYLRAVHSAIAADINEKYRSYDSTSDGQKRAEQLAPTIDDHRRNLRWAIRDLLGTSRCTVELI